MPNDRTNSRASLARMGAVALVFATCTIPEARAATVLAQGIMSELMALARPAFGVGIAWIGYLVAMGRGSLQLVVTFLIGAAIVFAGGHLS
jgi:TrbC/VIRB2 pilin